MKGVRETYVLGFCLKGELWVISLGQANEGDYYKLDYRQARRESWGGSGSMTACFFVKIMLRDLNLLFTFTL